MGLIGEWPRTVVASDRATAVSNRVAVEANRWRRKRINRRTLRAAVRPTAVRNRSTHSRSTHSRSIAQPAPAPAPATEDDMFEQLKRLAQLHDQGILTTRSAVPKARILWT